MISFMILWICFCEFAFMNLLLWICFCKFASVNSLSEFAFWTLRFWFRFRDFTFREFAFLISLWFRYDFVRFSRGLVAGGRDRAFSRWALGRCLLGELAVRSYRTVETARSRTGRSISGRWQISSDSFWFLLNFLRSSYLNSFGQYREAAGNETRPLARQRAVGLCGWPLGLAFRVGLCDLCEPLEPAGHRSPIVMIRAHK